MGPSGSNAALPSTAKPESSYAEERAIIERLRSGEHEAFEMIFRRYINRVYQQVIALVGNDADAEEIVQEVFLAIYRKAKSFRGDSAFSTWLYRLTLNVCLTRLRRRKIGKTINLDGFLPCYVEGISNREICETLGLSIPAVKARLHRARLFLRGNLAVSLGYSPT